MPVENVTININGSGVSVDSTPLNKVVADIAARNAIASGDRSEALIAYVLDASDDATVNSGGAAYILKSGLENTDWVKISEFESMDLDAASLGLSNATLEGNTFNGASQLVKLDGTGKLPAVDGSSLTNLPGGGRNAYSLLNIYTSKTVDGNWKDVGMKKVSAGFAANKKCRIEAEIIIDSANLVLDDKFGFSFSPFAPSGDGILVGELFIDGVLAERKVVTASNKFYFSSGHQIDTDKGLIKIAGVLTNQSSPSLEVSGMNDASNPFYVKKYSQTTITDLTD